jgi:hypothetical protein
MRTVQLLQLFLIGYNTLATMHVSRMVRELAETESPIQSVTDVSGLPFACPAKDYQDYPIIYGEASTTDMMWIDTSLHVMSTDYSALVIYVIFRRLFPMIFTVNVCILLMGFCRWIMDYFEEEPKDD